MTETQKKTLGLAIASFVLGCFFFIPLIGFLLSVPAVILGIIALVKISHSNNTLGGSGFAIGGIIMGAIAILIIPILFLMAAIAIPNFLRARLHANEAAAISSLRTIGSACEAYRIASNPPTYPSSLSDLSNANPPYIDAMLGYGTKQGYTFTYTNKGASRYECIATPITENATGIHTFYIDDTGVIRLRNANGPPIE